MRLGIMATTFARPALEATLDAVAACGVQSVQFDLACAGVPTLIPAVMPLDMASVCHLNFGLASRRHPPGLLACG